MRIKYATQAILPDCDATRRLDRATAIDALIEALIEYLNFILIGHVVLYSGYILQICSTVLVICIRHICMPYTKQPQYYSIYYCASKISQVQPGDNSEGSHLFDAPESDKHAVAELLLISQTCSRPAGRQPYSILIVRFGVVK